MSTPTLVTQFYERIWNEGDLSAIADTLSEDFCFRGSLGAELRGCNAFEGYVRSVRQALASYRCEILGCVSEADQAFAKMRFSGLHVDSFRGYPGTGKAVEWLGAAFFSFKSDLIVDLWVVADLSALDLALKHNSAT